MKWNTRAALLGYLEQPKHSGWKQKIMQKTRGAAAIPVILVDDAKWFRLKLQKICS